MDKAPRSIELKVVAVGNSRGSRLSWEDSYREMAREQEDWSNLDPTIADGIDPEEKW